MQDSTAINNIVTSKQYAEIKGLSHSHVKNLLRKGKILGVKVGRDWLIDILGEPINLKYLPTAKIVAKWLGFSHSHMRRLLREGKLKGIKVGRDWLIIDLEQEPYRRERSINSQRS